MAAGIEVDRESAGVAHRPAGSQFSSYGPVSNELLGGRLGTNLPSPRLNVAGPSNRKGRVATRATNGAMYACRCVNSGEWR